MKATVFAGIIILLLSYHASAQDYNTAAGIRLGPNTAAIAPGFTIKHFLNETSAIEGIVGVSNGLGLCALYEWHHPIESVDRLQ